MKSAPLWMLALHVFVLFNIASHSAQVVADDRRNSGFISIDCGASGDYMDEVTGNWYQTDESFIESGSNHKLSRNYSTTNQLQMTLRSFPDGERNCYTLKPKQQKHQKHHKYLIRAIFEYGNYDFKDQASVFDLYLGVNYWTTVSIQYEDLVQNFEIIVQQDSSTEIVQVCLVNTGQGTPFINALELRPLNNSLYPAALPLFLIRRLDLGSLSAFEETRYKDDVYGRVWNRYDYNGWDPLHTRAEVKAKDSIYELPPEVMRTAVQPKNHSNFLTLNDTSDNISDQYYLFLHFAEIQKLPHGHKRIINVTFDDENSVSQELTLEYLKPVTVSSNKFPKGYISFTVNATDSDAPPILNAMEIYRVLPTPNSPTVTQDVNAMMEIKHIYGVSRISWQGDPCVPSYLAWEGLNCSSGGSNIRIISLNLRSSNLTGHIAAAFASLDKLENLDLSNNELSGPLPEYLATLPNLKFIDVTGNKLTGSIPKALREKANLQLSMANNPGLCQTNSCKKPKFVIPLIASLSAFVIVIVLISMVIWRFRKKTVSSTESPKIEGLKRKNKAFSYSEVLHITNNFETTIGEGRFGRIYLGTLKDDKQVAVKLLSLSSRQGYKEFQSEAQLLTVIHHRNLVSLVGFCDENDVKALIYECMDLGDLGRLLSEKSSNVLKWRERLQVAVDAANGLEYLHNGCKTPIVHGNLKPSNILLNKSMVAKIANFRLSTALFTNEKDSHLSTKPIGTSDYIDPEFQKSGRLNKESDVYSFGIILLQLITSHPPIKQELGNVCFIIDWVRSKIECGNIEGIVDPCLAGEFHVTSAWKAVEIAMSCVLPETKERPDISYVLHELSECLDMEMERTKPNGISSYPINHIEKFDSMTTLSAR